MLILAAEERTLPEEIGPTQMAPNWQIQNCLGLTEVERLWELAEAKYLCRGLEEVRAKCHRWNIVFYMGLADWSVFANLNRTTALRMATHCYSYSQEISF